MFDFVLFQIRITPRKSLVEENSIHNGKLKNENTQIHLENNSINQTRDFRFSN
jgi:hypothetical protein